MFLSRNGDSEILQRFDVAANRTLVRLGVGQAKPIEELLDGESMRLVALLLENYLHCHKALLMFGSASV